MNLASMRMVELSAVAQRAGSPLRVTACCSAEEEGSEATPSKPSSLIREM